MIAVIYFHVVSSKICDIVFQNQVAVSPVEGDHMISVFMPSELPEITFPEFVDEGGGFVPLLVKSNLFD